MEQLWTASIMGFIPRLFWRPELPTELTVSAWRQVASAESRVVGLQGGSWEEIPNLGRTEGLACPTPAFLILSTIMRSLSWVSRTAILFEGALLFANNPARKDSARDEVPKSCHSLKIMSQFMSLLS